MSRGWGSTFGSEAAGAGRRPPREPRASRSLTHVLDTAERLLETWSLHFGDRSEENQPFLRTLAGVILARQELGLFELTHQRLLGNQVTHDLPFQFRYRASAGLLGPTEKPPRGNVPLGFPHYLKEALRQTRRKEASRGGAPADADLLERLVTLGNTLLGDPRLAPFRVDRQPSTAAGIDNPFPPAAGESDPARLQRSDHLGDFVGKELRGYKIVEPLGRGGYGAVFLAEHATLRVKRALKIFLEIASGPGLKQVREKCLAEARIQSGLKHENIVEVVDVFEDHGYIVLVMEYVPGRNLADLIGEKNGQGVNLTPQEVLDLAIPIARGLSHAHRRGVVHRDIKPENILLGRPDHERPKIADFGLARQLEESGRRHRTAGYLVGTPVYMAPEQIARKARTYDHRCDIYSLGIVLYELALGTPPFAHEDNFKILEMHEKENPDSLSLRISEFPEELDRIILTCLNKRPEDRFGTAEELLQALEGCRTRLGGTRGRLIPPT